MTEVQKLASFVNARKYSDLSEAAVRELKIRLLDSLGCAIGALKGEPVKMVKEQLDDFGENPLATLIGGKKNAPDRAAFYNSTLVRYLDFNDSYLAKNETCHPSDNIGSVLAAAEYADKNGKEFLTALAIAYQVQCRLSDVAPVRDKGYDHTVQGAYGAAAGAAYALALEQGEKLVGENKVQELKQKSTAIESFHPEVLLSDIYRQTKSKKSSNGPRA